MTNKTETEAENEIIKSLNHYSKEFKKKRQQTGSLSKEHDLLMDVFNITPEEKQRNAQFWGRELGMLWQNIVKSVCKNSNVQYSGPITVTDPDGKSDEPCDLTVNDYAIDTKYRIGSGDSKFSKKFRPNFKILREQYKLTPVLLILRDDNLPSPIHRAEKEGWIVKTGNDSFNFLKELTNYDLKEFLKRNSGKY